MIGQFSLWCQVSMSKVVCQSNSCGHEPTVSALPSGDAAVQPVASLL